jgi:hypothetical protein
MRTKTLLLCAVAVAAAFSPAKSEAQSITATLDVVDPGLSVNGTVDGSFYQDWASGILDFTTFQAFCVEPLQGINYGETVVYQIQNPGTLNNSDSVAQLVGGYLASGRTNEDAAAVQWAIWEVILDSNPTQSLTAGVVNISPSGSATAALAQTYLANIGTYTPATLTYLKNSTRQDVVTWQAIPEPGTMGLAAFSALLLLRRRR